LADLREKLLGQPLPKKKVPKPSTYSKPRWKLRYIVASQNDFVRGINNTIEVFERDGKLYADFSIWGWMTELGIRKRE